MQSHGSVDMRILEHTGLDHGRRAGERFLVRLEHQLDHPVQVNLPFLEQPCGAEQHGRMQVVSACMRTRAGGRERQAAFFAHRQRVHIRTQ